MPSAWHPCFTDHPLANAHLFHESCDVCWFKRNPCPYYYTYWVSTRVQWFWLFHIFSAQNSPSLTPKNPRILKLAKKNSTSSMACEFFWQKPENAFFGLISKFNFRNPFWRANFLCGESIALRFCTTCYNCCQAGVILSVILMGLSLEKEKHKRIANLSDNRVEFLSLGLFLLTVPLKMYGFVRRKTHHSVF
jgi:hypothetical protein